MAQHDFAPAWLNFPTPPSSTKQSLNVEKNPETLVRPENRYDVNRRRHNSSDSLESSGTRSSGGNFGRKEKNGWRSQGRGTETVNPRSGYHGGNPRPRSGTFHGGKAPALHENNLTEDENGKKEEKEKSKQFEAEDFPSLNPESKKELGKNKSIAGVWENPPNPKSRTSKMLVIKKVLKEEPILPGYPLTGGSHPQPVKNGTGPSVYKGLVPKAAGPPAKPAQWKGSAKENKHGTPFVSFNALLKPVPQTFSSSPNSLKESSRSNSSSPIDIASQPRMLKLTRMRSDKKSDFLKTLKQDKPGEGYLDDGDSMDKEKDYGMFSMQQNKNTHQERDENRNFDKNGDRREKGNARTLSQSTIHPSAFPQCNILSSSLEAEHRLLKEMGWQEESENDETCAPLTEDEMREFQAISEQLQKNGLRKNGLLKNGLTCNFKFSTWKSTYKPTVDDTETSSSDTSDDDA
ncbi:vasculin isoform X1 [Rhincodon typus]|uniref:vasculin isoform X1 n=1 Tax=Rhincodon typus TaxID=259920 RepID=UPI00202F49BC|nr:vasculin isoform X1 [Rhincodon typus]